ncbi:MAG: SpoIIE family protein phosphatase [Spirochaetaceae bacterium]|jgi:sigma-B regulation protein RsbU (phosphoserine phosphatase)|nr:SpoIIE family protein phosphatase [Spirochaetaceae bacterium]
MSIKGKVLIVILSTSLGSLLLLSLATLVSIFNIRGTTLSHSDTLGEVVAGESQKALEAQMRQQMINFARDKASLADEKFRIIENYIVMTADIISHIYTYKEQYQPKYIDYVEPGEERSTVPYLMTAPGVSFSAIREEVTLAANVSDMLRQIAVVDIGVISSYIGGESGYTILMNKDLSAANRTDFDVKSRSWYVGAREKNGLFWSEVFVDALGRGAGISCAMPFYDESSGTRVLKGVAGSGALLTEVDRVINSSKIGKTGYSFLLDDKGRVVISPREKILHDGDPDRTIGEDYLHSDNPELRELAERMIGKQEGLMTLQISGEEVFVAYSPLEVIDFSMGIVMTVEEVTVPARAIRQDIINLSGEVVAKINQSFLAILLLIAGVIILAVGIALSVALRLSRSLTGPIVKLCKGAEIIGTGDLNYQLDVDSRDEIGVLAGTFNQMIRDIKTINGEKERINGELTAAADIQNSMLPRIFPRFSKRRELALYAKMMPAKEVGGDFYDFFYLDREETHIACIIADVSGKGVPAALFMVIAKTLLKVHLLSCIDPAETLETVNKLLYEDNPQGMFVTVFLCTFDLITGKMIYANGGHNPPLISLSGGPYQFMRLEKGIPPGMFGDSRYRSCELDLQTGDRLYLYTDGVNEAMNEGGEQFGNDRFLDRANRFRDLPPEEFDGAIRQELALFVQGAEQSDDITTLAIAYKGKYSEAPRTNPDTPPVFERETTLPAVLDNLDRLLEWIETVLEDYSCPPKTCHQMAVVTEEIFVNIVNYAYPEGSGDVTLRAGRMGEAFVVQFEDDGVPFDPSEWPDPDTKAVIEDRNVGGLGLYLAKKMTDHISYQRLDGKNLLTILKAPEKTQGFADPAPKLYI